MFSSAAADLKDVPDEFTTLIQTKDGLCAVPDIRKIGFQNSRTIVSRKRTRNLFDLTSLWKKMVLSGYDKEVSNQPGTSTDTHLDGDNATDSDGDDDVDHGLDYFADHSRLLERGVIVHADSPTRKHPNPFERRLD